MKTRRSPRNQHILARALGLEGRPTPKPERKRKPYAPRYARRTLERQPTPEHWHTDDSGLWYHAQSYDQHRLSKSRYLPELIALADELLFGDVSKPSENLKQALARWEAAS